MSKEQGGMVMFHQMRLQRKIRVGVVLVASLMMSLLIGAAPLEVGVASAAGVPVEFGQQLHVHASLSELPMPPTVPSNGVCTNPTGCVSPNWGALGSPGFYWDSNYVLLGLNYAGAPSGGPANIYQGPQVMLEKTDGTTFSDGDAWKCITCGVTIPPGVVTRDFTYPPPHALPGDERVLVGNAILQCTEPSTGTLLQLTDPNCTPANTQIFPIYWGSAPLGGSGGILGNGREWRLSPDGVHLVWDNIVFSGGNIGEDEFEGTLSWDASNQRYDLIDVYFLPQADVGWTVKSGNQLVFTPQAMIGEARGWSSDGQSILGIQEYEANSIDAWENNLTTSQARPLTDHAEYTDPMQMSPNGKWMINEEVAGSGRMDWLSGLEGISSVSGLMSTGDVAQMRNAGNRRFFEPWLTSTSARLTEQVNAAIANPDWNAAADPDWLANSSGVVWAENFACGANAPTSYCPGSAEPGGRNSRVMMARLSLAPSPALPPAPISDTAPSAWAIPYTKGQALPAYVPPPTGTYTVKGDLTGYATVVITDNASDTAIQSMRITYHNYLQIRGLNVINGTEDLDATTVSGDLTWNENVTAFGLQGFGKQVTSPGGFSVNSFDLNFNNFQATGAMTTTLNGQTYTQPANGN